MQDPYIYEPIPYSAGEIEEVTGVGPANQRDWRRRGFIRSRVRSTTGAWPNEVAQILAIQALRTDLGLSLEVSAAHALQIAPSVLCFALTLRAAWRFEGSREEEKRFYGYLDKKQDSLTNFCEIVGAPKASISWYSVLYGGKWVLTNDVGSLFDLREDKQVGGIVLNHQAIAEILFDRAKRPIYRARARRGSSNR